MVLGDVSGNSDMPIAEDLSMGDIGMDNNLRISEEK